MLKIRFFDPADEPKPKKTTYRLIYWPDYNQALIQRGRLTLWLDEDTIANWYYEGPNGPGGLYRYSDVCIQCALSLKSVLKLAFRQIGFATFNWRQILVTFGNKPNSTHEEETASRTRPRD